MALTLTLSRASLNSTGRIAYIKDTTSYTETGGWDDGTNPARTAAAIVIFCTKIGKTAALDTEINLLSTYDPEAAPETSDANSPTYLSVDVYTNGDGIYFYECAALKFIGTAGGSDEGYYWDDANNYVVSWDGSTATEVADPYAVRTAIMTSGASNDGLLDDYSFYDIITTQAAATRDDLAVDLTDVACDCTSAENCSKCVDKKRIYEDLRLQIEGALANYARASYTSAAKNFEMITNLTTQITDLD